MESSMKFLLSEVGACVLAGLAAGTPALAQKKGGVLRIYQHDSPASMSVHEEALNSAQNPMMAVFNNLVVFKQDEPQNRLDTIVPDLATKWSWNGDSRPLLRCLPRVIRRFIRAMCRRRVCERTRSALARSNSFRINRMNRSS